MNTMSEYSNMLKLSGYSEQFRANTIKGVMSRWETVQSDVASGNRVLHRSQDQIALQKASRGGNNSASWFLREQTTSTMKFPMTPGSELRNKIQESIKNVRGPDGGFKRL